MSTSGTILMAVGVVASVLAGCASGSSNAWIKPGSTEEERGRDTLSCLSSSRGIREIDQTRYRQCMHDLGYVEATR